MGIVHAHETRPEAPPCDACEGLGGDPEGDRVCRDCLGTGVAA